MSGTEEDQEEEPVSKATHWDDDVLGRRRYASYLTTYLDGRTKLPETGLRPFTLALDADWGLGKSFFIDRWSRDLEIAQPARLSFVFNAWKADYGSDALFAFIAALKSALEERLSAARPDALVKKKSADAAAKLMKQIRRAAMPTAKAMVVGYIRQKFGDGVEAALRDSCAEEGESSQARAARSDAALDTLFENMLKEEEGRDKLIDEFKSSVKAYLEAICSATSAELPMYIFVDELDRCRPSFAIELLEAIKHLFDIEGLVFVVSTNMNQLSEAVKAVYGQGFASRAYLKRFFDAEYALPDPEATAHVRLLVKDRLVLRTLNFDFGLPYNGVVGWDKVDELEEVLGWVFRSFDLDLRSQAQVIEVFTAAALGHDQTLPVHAFLLGALCAINHRFPEIFRELEKSSTDPGTFVESLRKAGMREEYVTFNLTLPPHHPSFERLSPRAIACHDALTQYLAAAGSTGQELKDYSDRLGNEMDYPGYLIDRLNIGKNGQWLGKVERPYIARYATLVRQAGYFSAPR